MEEYQERSMYRSLKLLVIITIIAITILVGLLGFWAFWPYKVVDTSPDPYLIVYPSDKVVHPGEYVTYEFNYTKYTSHLPIIQRQFVDGLVFNVAGNSEPTITEPGRGTARVQVHVPETLPPGEYQLRITATYQLNPIRTYQHINLTEKFIVEE